MKLTTSVMAYALCALLFAGCGSATLARKDAGGGRILLQGSSMTAMADARVLMAEHCGGRSDVVQAGDSVEFLCHAPGH